MDEQPCTLPVEYGKRTWTVGVVYGQMLPVGPHFLDMKFTDECGQVETERVYFDLENETPGFGKNMYCCNFPYKTLYDFDACNRYFKLV